MCETNHILKDESNKNCILMPQIKKLLSENGYSISQTRGLFDWILSDLERYMPITMDNIEQ